MNKLNNLMCRVLRRLLAMGIFQWLPDKPYLELMYCSYFGRKLDLENPKSLNEKLQWLIIRDFGRSTK